MYHRYFGMKHRPFTATPQTGSCYPAPNQEEALATLHYAVTQGRGIAVLTGLPGTGKTLVCHRLTTDLEGAFTTAMITNTHMPTVKGLLQAILYDLSVPFHGLDEQELRLTLTDFLLGKYAGGGRMVLVVDEAQNLGVELLEELRMFSNLEGESDKLFQIVLAGHPRLLEILRNPQLETLTQRIGARATLTALSDEETVAYVQHQVACAGARWDEVFSYDSLCAICDATAGVPRLINQVCDLALLHAYVTETRRVEAAIVARAVADLELPTEQRISGEATSSAAMADVEPAPVAELYRAAVPEANLQQSAATFVACTECMGSLESMEINTYDMIKDADPLLALTIESGAEQPVPSQTLGEYIEEEIVLDPYAMMDAAKTAAAVRPSSPVGRTASIARYRDESTAMPTPESVLTESFLPDVRFVESGDNPPVHEVGADTLRLNRKATEPPILVIENREQRIGNQIGRVDSPQQPGQGNRGYRRLFTHARKS